MLASRQVVAHALTPVALTPVTSRVCPAPGPPSTSNVAPTGGNIQ